MKILKRLPLFPGKKRINTGDNDNGKKLPSSEDNSETELMIRGIRELSLTTVKEVLVPRIDTTFISLDNPVEESLQKMLESGHSRFPVYRETIDNVIGVIHVKDLLQILLQKEDIKFESLMRKPYFVPDSKRLDSLLKEFKKKRVHFAVAVDEYGGVSGVVSLEDILEEIVGDIQDEFDNEREEILELEKGIFLCDARVDIDDINEKLQLNIPDEDFDTIGGFVFSLFGKIPVRYEKVTYKNCDFIIQNVDGHKIKMLKIVYHEELPDEKE